MARVLALDGLLDPASLPDYISGVLIADELRHQLPKYATTGRFVVCGAPELSARYCEGIGAERHRATHGRAEDATARGLWTIATRTGLIDSSHRRTRRQPPMTTQQSTDTGLVAILRGITPAEVMAVGTALVEEGFSAIEVPMNSPDPLRSIELLATESGEQLPHRRRHRRDRSTTSSEPSPQARGSSSHPTPTPRSSPRR